MDKIDFKKQNIPFTMVANGVLNDKRLSNGAKGLYAYLYSKPDGWQFSAVRIAQESTSGKAAVKTQLNELENCGYLRRTRLATGRMVYEVIYPPEEPNAENRTLAQKPNAEKATVGKSHSGKIGTLSNKENSIVIKKEQSNTIAAEAAAPKEFSLKEEIQKLYDSPRRDLNLIGWYFEKRLIDVRDKKQLQSSISRHLRSAKQLEPFSDEQIGKAYRYVSSEYSEWTLETVVKKLTK